MYRHTKSVDWCQCCIWGVALTDGSGSSDFFGNYNSPQIVHMSYDTCRFHIFSPFLMGNALPFGEGASAGGGRGNLFRPRLRSATFPKGEGLYPYNNFTNYAVGICKKAILYCVLYFSPLLCYYNNKKRLHKRKVRFNK